MKKRELLSKADMKKITGRQGQYSRNAQGCLQLGEACQHNYDCCSGLCAVMNGGGFCDLPEN